MSDLELAEELASVGCLLRGAMALDGVGVFDARSIAQDLIADAENVVARVLAHLDRAAALGGER